MTRDHALLALELAARLGTTPTLRAAFAPCVWRARAALAASGNASAREVTVVDFGVSGIGPEMTVAPPGQGKAPPSDEEQSVRSHDNGANPRACLAPNSTESLWLAHAREAVTVAENARAAGHAAVSLAAALHAAQCLRLARLCGRERA